MHHVCGRVSEPKIRHERATKYKSRHGNGSVWPLCHTVVDFKEAHSLGISRRDILGMVYQRYATRRGLQLGEGGLIRSETEEVVGTGYVAGYLSQKLGLSAPSNLSWAAPVCCPQPLGVSKNVMRKGPGYALSEISNATNLDHPP